MKYFMDAIGGQLHELSEHGDIILQDLERAIVWYVNEGVLNGK